MSRPAMLAPPIADMASAAWFAAMPRSVSNGHFRNEPIDPLNKTLLAFAAYNCGPGRVAQLRRQAQRRGLNPNVWFNNVESVAGEVVGRETVDYVSRIDKYYIAYKLAEDQRKSS